MARMNANYNSEDAAAISASWMISNVDFRTRAANGAIEQVVNTASLREKWDQSVAQLRQMLSSKEAAPFSQQDGIANQWWDRIVDLHSAPDRAYHTLVHLREMMGYLDLLTVNKSEEQIGDDKEATQISMVLSVFFHDAIYDPKSATNEEDSARLLQEFCRDMGVTEKLENLIVRYILATKSHKLLTEDANDPNLALFLDIDMAVLGKKESAYLHYAGLIRIEYNFVDRAVYCEKRADILEKFLEEPKIFTSPIMHATLEQQARHNLSKEISLLREGTVPGETTIIS